MYYALISLKFSHPLPPPPPHQAFELFKKGLFKFLLHKTNIDSGNMLIPNKKCFADGEFEKIDFSFGAYKLNL